MVVCYKKVGGCTQASRRLTDLIQNPTCLCMEVQNYLTEYALNTASIGLNGKPSTISYEGMYRAARAAKKGLDPKSY